MNLFEEYHQRHGLKCPVIKRPDQKLNVIYRADKSIWKCCWVVLQITIKTENYHPSFYNFSWYQPRHNSERLVDISPPARVDWEDYEREILKTARREDGLFPIVSLSEARMAAWEMFVYSADEKLSAFPSAVRRDLLRSIDPKAPIEDRMSAHEAVIQSISTNSFYRFWSTMQSYCSPERYGAWYAELVMQMRDKTYREDFSSLQSVV